MQNLKNEFSNSANPLSPRPPTLAPTSTADHLVVLQTQQHQIEHLQQKHRMVRDAILRILEPMHAAPVNGAHANAKSKRVVAKQSPKDIAKHHSSAPTGVTPYPTPEATFVPYLQRVFTPVPTPATTQPTSSPTWQPTAPPPSISPTNPPTAGRPTAKATGFPTSAPTPEATFRPFREGNNDREWVDKQIKKYKKASSMLASSVASKTISNPNKTRQHREPTRLPTQKPTAMATMKPHLLVRIRSLFIVIVLSFPHSRLHWIYRGVMALQQTERLVGRRSSMPRIDSRALLILLRKLLPYFLHAYHPQRPLWCHLQQQPYQKACLGSGTSRQS